MLRKRTRSQQRDNQLTNNLMACAIPSSYFHLDTSNQNHKNTPFLNAPGLFVGSNCKSPDSDSSRSPTSPLDFRIFSGLGNPFRRPRAPSPSEGYPKSWDCHKVGLSIIDSLDDEANLLGNVAGSLDNKNILFGRQMSVRSLNPSSHASFEETRKSLTEKIPVLSHNRARSTDVQKDNFSNVVFEIGEVPSELKPRNFHACLLDSGRYGSFLINSAPQNTKNLITPEPGFLGGSLKSGCFISSVPASEIELSEDYTCVRTHGPNPKVVHIFGDCILGCHSDQVAILSEDGYIPPNIPAAYNSNDFLKFCYTCCKKLDGQDIYMYRGEKAFCSYNCRLEEIEIDEAVDETNNNNTSEIP